MSFWIGLYNFHGLSMFTSCLNFTTVSKVYWKYYGNYVEKFILYVVKKVCNFSFNFCIFKNHSLILFWDDPFITPLWTSLPFNPFEINFIKQNFHAIFTCLLKQYPLAVICWILVRFTQIKELNFAIVKSKITVDDKKGIHLDNDDFKQDWKLWIITVLCELA